MNPYLKYSLLYCLSGDGGPRGGGPQVRKHIKGEELTIVLDHDRGRLVIVCRTHTCSADTDVT